MNALNLSLIRDAFSFAIKRPISHIVPTLKAFLIGLVAYNSLFLCFLLPALGIISAITLYVFHYERNIIANSLPGAASIASFFALIWLFIGWLQFYNLMYHHKPLRFKGFFLPARLFAKVYLLLPFTFPLWLIIFPQQPVMVLVQSFFTVAGASFIPMLLMFIITALIVLYWAAMGQCILLELIEGTPIKNALSNAFYLTNRNLLTALLYELALSTITVTLSVLLSQFSGSLWSIIVLGLTCNYVGIVIIPASLVYFYKRLKGINPDTV